MWRLVWIKVPGRARDCVGLKGAMWGGQVLLSLQPRQARPDLRMSGQAAPALPGGLAPLGIGPAKSSPESFQIGPRKQGGLVWCGA